MNKHYRQGDVLVIETAEIPNLGKPVPRDADGSVTLAHGEATGHRHRFGPEDRHCTLFQGESLDDDMFLHIGSGGAALVHEEHARIDLPKGSKIVRRQREYTPKAIRRVED